MASPSHGSYSRLVPQLICYGGYHAHPVNVAIHAIFGASSPPSCPLVSSATSFPRAVPAILATAFVFTSYCDLTPYAPRVVAEAVGGRVSLDMIAACFYALRYVYFSPNAVGLSAGALVLALFRASQLFIQAYGPGAWAPSLALHLVGWAAQVFVGHAIFEQRAPALLDNLQQVRAAARGGPGLLADCNAPPPPRRPSSLPRSSCTSRASWLSGSSHALRLS